MEQVLAHRERPNRRRVVYDYLIKWLGYGHEHNTWELEDHLPESLRAKYWRDHTRRVERRAAEGLINS